jgi:hypothetical protein
MARYCRVCGRRTEGDDDFCEGCKESIRAEALGKQKKIAKEVPGKGREVGNREKGGADDKEPLSPSHHEEEQKKPHHFKSMAEYLEYLKKKGG